MSNWMSRRRLSGGEEQHQHCEDDVHPDGTDILVEFRTGSSQSGRRLERRSRYFVLLLLWPFWLRLTYHGSRSNFSGIAYSKAKKEEPHDGDVPHDASGPFDRPTHLRRAIRLPRPLHRGDNHPPRLGRLTLRFHVRSRFRLGRFSNGRVRFFKRH